MSQKIAKRTFSDDQVNIVLDNSSNAGSSPSPVYQGPTHFGHFLTLFALIALVLAGGGKFLWVEGLFLVLIGGMLIYQPPEVTIDSKVDWTVLLLLGAACMAFVPSGWFNFLPGMLFGRPGWWQTVGQAGVELPVTASPQPIRTLEGLALLSGVLAFYYLLINCRFRVEDRWRLLQTFVVLGGMLAIVVVYGATHDLQYFITERARTFSFFDNRNQTSILLVMIGVVSLAMMVYGARLRWWWGLLSGVAFFSCAVAVSVSLSRAGLLLFVLGCGVWVILRFTVYGEGFMRYVAPLVALSFSLMLITGQQTLSRFDSWVGSAASIFKDFRWLIYGDTLSLVAAQPFTGVGMGNYASVIPFYRVQSLDSTPVIHPESDWLWLAAEMGVPGFSVMAVLLFMLVWFCFPFGTDKLVPVRVGALVAVGVFLFHSVFDVSAHQIGVALIAIWLFRMAMPHLKTTPECLFPPWLWRLSGAALLLIGGLWITADATGLALHSSQVRAQVEHELAEASASQDSTQVMQAIETGLFFLPMDWRLHLQRGQVELYLNKDTSKARNDFLAARALEPVLVAPAFFEGQVWLPHSTHYAYEAWEEALRRPAANPTELQYQILLAARANPRFARELDRLSQLTPDFRVAYLASRDRDDFLRALTDDLRRDPKLVSFSEAQREAIMQLWLDRGDPGQMIRFLEKYPEAAPNAWYYQAHAMARMGNYPAALELVSANSPVPQIPAMQSLMVRDVQEQRALFAAQPTDIVRGGMLLKTQLQNHDAAGAKWTVDQLLKLENPPPYVYYWQGELNRLDQNYREAWQGWRRYLAEVVERKIELKSTPEDMFGGINDTDDNPLLWKLAEPFQR